MAARLLLTGALLVAALAFFFSGGPKEPVATWPPYVRGQNKTALILSNKEHGLSNVLIATASALLERYPDIDVHYASFPGLTDKLQRVSDFARTKTPAARDIVYHQLKGRSYEDVIVAAGKSLDNIPHPPAIAGIDSVARDMQMWVSPWSFEDHLDLYNEIVDLINELDPAVVVLDTIFRPALDAVRGQNRQHMFITPNTNVDNFLGDQPYGSMFWKYPAIASGFAFPVPWHKIPENIYLNARVIYSIVVGPALREKKAQLAAMGVPDPLNFFALHRHDVPWVTMTTEGASVPVDYVPPNVTAAGPIVLSAATAAEQDAEMAAWLKKAPTVLINLGSSVSYTETRAKPMTAAIVEVLSKTDAQIIWKFRKEGDYSDDMFAPLQPFIARGRLIMSKWLTVDPVSLLETGDIVVSVHHGGSNCYHEANATGVAQVILPLWIDLYNFAALAEGTGVGTYGCPKTSPNWTAECITEAMMAHLDGSEKAADMKSKAKALGDKVREKEAGRYVAASIVADLAYVK